MTLKPCDSMIYLQNPWPLWIWNGFLFISRWDIQAKPQRFDNGKRWNFSPCQWWGDSEAMACGNAHKIWTTIPPSRNPGSASPQVGVTWKVCGSNFWFCCCFAIFNFHKHITTSTSSWASVLAQLAFSAGHHWRRMQKPFWHSWIPKTKSRPFRFWHPWLKTKITNQSHPKITIDPEPPKNHPTKQKSWCHMIGCSQKGMKQTPREPGHFLHLRISHIAIPRLLGQWGNLVGSWRKKNQGTDSLSVVPNNNETRASLRCKPKKLEFSFEPSEFFVCRKNHWTLPKKRGLTLCSRVLGSPVYTSDLRSHDS